MSAKGKQKKNQKSNGTGEGKEKGKRKPWVQKETAAMAELSTALRSLLGSDKFNGKLTATDLRKVVKDFVAKEKEEEGTILRASPESAERKSPPDSLKIGDMARFCVAYGADKGKDVSAKFVDFDAEKTLCTILVGHKSMRAHYIGELS